MNILVFDLTECVSPVVRSALLSAGHRVSVEGDSVRAMLKLETALFDGIVLGPGEVPRDLANYLDEEWPTLPRLLAGGDREVEARPPVAAVLASPLSLDRLLRAMRKIERHGAAAARRAYDMPVDVEAGERRLACRVVRIAKGSMLLEGIGAVEGPLTIRRGGASIAGDVAFGERDLVAVRVEAGALESLEQQLEVGDAEGRPGAPPGRRVPRL